MKLEDVKVGDCVVMLAIVDTIDTSALPVRVLTETNDYFWVNPKDIELATKPTTKPTTVLKAELKTPLEILGVGLKSFRTPDDKVYTDRMFDCAGKTLALQKSATNLYDYIAVCECGKSMPVESNWLKNIREEHDATQLKKGDVVWVSTVPQCKCIHKRVEDSDYLMVFPRKDCPIHGKFHASASK